MRIALAQVDTTVGDLDGNVELLIAWTARASEANADVVVFPELAITGYPPEDLVLRPSFVDDNLEALETLAAETAGGCAVVVGFVDRTDRGIHNAAALIGDGIVAARYHKVKLPNYGVFDERRTFVPGDAACPVRLADAELGLSVCEDAWMPGAPWEEYAARKTPVILNINASPFHRGKSSERFDISRDRALETGSWIVYVNAVGGQDELVFDGGSIVVRPDGSLAHHGALFEEDLLVVEIDGDQSSGPEGGTGPGTSSRSTRRSCSVSATTSARTASTRWCSGSRAGSTRRSWRCSPRTRSGRGGADGRDALALLVGREPRGRARWRPPSAPASTSSRWTASSRATSMPWRNRSGAPSRAWPRRTSRRASAATC